VANWSRSAAASASPDVIRQGGAGLVEVGTTNRTRLRDYAEAIGPATRLLLRVHQSNFSISGFTALPDPAAIAALARERGLLSVVDLGSGAMIDLSRHGLPAEPTLGQGGGAGLRHRRGQRRQAAGRSAGRAGAWAGGGWWRGWRAHPLMRALRPDKLTLAALEATLRLYRDPDSAVRAIPALAMLAAPLAQVSARAERLLALLPQGESTPGTSLVGGGSLPAVELPSRLVALDGPAEALAAGLRGGDPRGDAAHRRRPAAAGYAHGGGGGGAGAGIRHPRRTGGLRMSSGRMRSALVGVLGHVDHGKTALVRALTGTDTDRLPEEKARGISIALGFARLRQDDAEIDLVDVPGHERFLRTMVAGATAIEAALLCIDAAEGVRAQTVEHAEVAALLGLSRGVVAVTRCDRAGDAAAAEAGRAGAAGAARAGGMAGRQDLGHDGRGPGGACGGAGRAGACRTAGDGGRLAAGGPRLLPPRRRHRG
jgi:small GTP-binding protein